MRVIAFALLIVAALLLTFGLGWGVNDLTGEETVRIVETAGDPAPASAGAAQEDADEPAAAQSGGASSELAAGGAILEEIYDILQASFVDKEILDERSLRDAAIRGALQSLNDPYTEYISPSDLDRGVGSIESVYEGIGATVRDDTGVIQIGIPFSGSPAEQAGIRAGDIILAVDGESTEGWTVSQAVQRIRGARGTEVTLTVRHLDGETEDITIVRDSIPLYSVFAEYRGEGGFVDRAGNPVTDLFYVYIEQFHQDTPNELRAALKDVENGDYAGLIVDLRNNPGGFLQQTVEATDEFLNEGAILTEIDSDGNRQTFGALEGGVATSIPIVVIQNRLSASGAEVLAAGLADNGRAVIVGERSVGKGTVNNLFQLNRCGQPGECGALYVSTGRWLRPNGQVIEGLGIVPDYEIPLTGDDLIEYGDLQLFAAIDLLRGEEPPPPPERPEGESTDDSEDVEDPEEPDTE